ncbi:MAG: hypothetical protein BWX96_00341 [Bacteroidetes bacterium ADurb.Bin145]|nr:MAG: hypothetical protein BWX96_00341 [Bacteroidetes bacterium ADurb.Bin145]
MIHLQNITINEPKGTIIVLNNKNDHMVIIIK